MREQQKNYNNVTMLMRLQRNDRTKEQRNDGMREQWNEDTKEGGYDRIIDITPALLKKNQVKYLLLRCGALHFSF